MPGGSKVWWQNSRAMDELYDSFVMETSWHANQRALQLDMMRTKREQTQQRMLERRELFPVNKLKAQIQAEAEQRACDEALDAEIIFLPKLPAARRIAEVSENGDMCASFIRLASTAVFLRYPFPNLPRFLHLASGLNIAGNLGKGSTEALQSRAGGGKDRSR